MSVHVDLSHLNKVWEVKPLKMLGEDEARKILENVAKQVEPIMNKHRWKVSLLSEFCPSDPSLLGLNIGGGAEIKLRLRRQKQEWDFLPFEQILDTMLHELCHNVHGPHNSDFYKLLDEIRVECEQLMAKGIGRPGHGSNLLPGRRLGGSSNPPPLPLLRQHALAAAQSRARQAGLLPTGPRRVGGDSSIRTALSPVQAAAMAAERRLHDESWCGSNSPRQIGEQANIGPSSTVLGRPTASGFTTNAGSEQGSVTWQCGACTLINQCGAMACEACEAPRKEEGESKFKGWCCKFCTLKNRVGVDRCSACGEWRYSYGSPLTPFHGT